MRTGLIDFFRAGCRRRATGRAVRAPTRRWGSLREAHVEQFAAGKAVAADLLALPDWRRTALARHGGPRVPAMPVRRASAERRCPPPVFAVQL
ncbi:hypothetical protein [Streptomyces sp. NPDC018972]|uniref:hypothetical protein n=1 Tax=Streptomyces sp. NPDC018972 TaxID=3365060 RepID=UPI0037BA9E19